MSKKVIIFGTQDYAELAHYYLKNDSSHEVVCFLCKRKVYAGGKKNLKDYLLLPLRKLNSVIPWMSFLFLLRCLPKK
jgi:hypothetical protein